MVNRPSPTPHTHHQLQHWVATLKKAHQPPTTLTVGRGQPSTGHASLAMAAWTTLGPATTPHQGWPTLRWTGDPATDHATFRRHACGTWPRKAAVVALAGAHTPAIAWIFADASILLSEIAGDRLHLYPAALWLLQRENGWTPHVLMGKGKEGSGAHLRIAYLGRPAKQRATPTDTLEAYAALAPGYRAPTGILADLQADIDRLHGAFAARTGRADWPDGRVAIPDSRWPPFLPHCPHHPDTFAHHRRLLEGAAGWIHAYAHTKGQDGAHFSLSKHHNALLLEWGHSPDAHPITRAVISTHDIADLFPPALADGLVALLASPDGLAYCCANPGRPEAQPWSPLRTTITGVATQHQTLHTFGQWGTPPPAAAHTWAALHVF